MYYHLYNPATNTHYVNGGCMTPAENPIPEGWQWLEGVAPTGSGEYKLPSPIDNAKTLLATLPDAVKAKHYNTINNVRNAIENEEWGVVPYLLAAVNTETPEEAEALARITEALTGG